MKKVFGRRNILERIWKLLLNDSILFTAERRVGKTTVLDELNSAPKKGFIVIYSDLEKIDSPLEFINDVLNKTAPFISQKDKATGWFSKLWETLEGAEVGGVFKIPEHKEKDWKTLLLVTIDAICKNNNGDIVVFLWDELPYMLQKINEHEVARDGVENSSLQIMDTLRALRQEHANLRMVFTGSIGLHHVLNSITKETYVSAPINDMEKVELKPLDKEPAYEMVKFHLAKENKSSGVKRETMENIASQCDFIPFYIEKLIRRLSLYDKPVTQKLVDDEIAYILTDNSDDWELEHFRNRLSSYYKGEIADANNRKIKKSLIAKAILNHCAMVTTPQSIDQCYQSVKSDFSIDGRDLTIELLKNLVKDHYLQRDTKGNYQFYFSLIRRWWVLAEGLSEFSEVKSERYNDA